MGVLRPGRGGLLGGEDLALESVTFEVGMGGSVGRGIHISPEAGGGVDGGGSLGGVGANLGGSAIGCHEVGGSVSCGDGRLDLEAAILLPLTTGLCLF